MSTAAPAATTYADYSRTASVDAMHAQALPGPESFAGAITESYDPAWNLPCDCWRPQPGPQIHALQAVGLIKILLFGGTRGGGKTEMLLGDQILNACKWGPWWNGMIVRKKYKDFASLRKRIDELIRMGLPAERFGGETQLGLVRFRNGATVYLQAIPRLELADDHQGLAYTRISIEEAPLLPFIGQLIDKLKGCVRSPQGVPTGFVLTGNPGGPGAAQIKLMFMEDEHRQHIQPGTVIRERGADRVFIKSRLEDNRILAERDPDYMLQLQSIKDPLLRRAWLEGDWDAFIGQAFAFVAEPPPRGHVIDPIWPIPNYVPLYMSFDWGYGKPFSIGWWWLDSMGTLIRFAEWYGWDGDTPDVGLRLTDEQIAQGIMDRERAMGIAGRHNDIIRLAGPDCWNKKPSYLTGGQGPSTAKVFKAYGDARGYNLLMRPGDPNRALKIRQFRSRLAPDARNGMPLLLVYNTCYHFIRTIPALAMDELKPEDVDTDQEDHIYDEACHPCMANPIALSDEAIVERVRHEEAMAKRSQLDRPSQIASAEVDRVMERIKRRERDIGDTDSGEERVW